MAARLPLLFLVLAGLVAARLHNLREGAECYTKYDERGICTKARRCPGIISRVRNGENIRMCSYSRSGPIICCSSRALVEKAKTKCNDYGEYVYVTEILRSLSIIPEVHRTAKCHIIGQQRGLVYGGAKAGPMQFPHMAALGFGEHQDSIQWVCGGSLISDWYILTAAHCAYNGSQSVGWVRLGDINLVRSDDHTQPQTFRVAKIITHPAYRPPSNYHDIALLKMDGAPKLGEFVRPACLYTEPENPRVDQVIATGWGVTEHSKGATSDDLMYVVLKFQDYNQCKIDFPRKHHELAMGILDESMICAGDDKSGNDTCQGDSGGPLQFSIASPFCMYGIVGITSFGSERCGSSSAVYTRVSKYVPWIVSVAWP